MRVRLSKVVAAVLAGVMLLTVPGLVGCGDDGGGGGKPQIVIGYLGDFSGPGAFAVGETFEGMRDYAIMAEEESLIPEVRLKFITYDSKGDRGRVQPGYKWLKGQGADLISTISGMEASILQSSLEADEIPCFTSGGSVDIFGSDWAYSEQIPPAGEGQAIGHWIEETWDGQAPAKVGIVGMGPLNISSEVEEAIAEWCTTAANLEFVTSQMVPYGTVTWAAEIAHLKDCDFIIDTTIGSSMASFEKAIRLSGYNGQLVGIMETFTAFWELTRSIVSSADLDGAVAFSMYIHWTDDVPFINEMREWNSHFLTPEEIIVVLGGCGRIGGWAKGMITVEAIKVAVAAVGAENVDGKALRDGLLAMDLTVEGWGSAWKVFADVNCYMQTVRMMKWDGQKENWYSFGDWYRPPLTQR